MIRIYVEGDKGLKPGFRKFFGENRPITLIVGKNTQETEKDFLDGLKSHPDSSVFMLIDADAPLSNRPPDPRRFFMIQIMESWFLADRKALAEYFGEGFNPKTLPGDPRKIESIPKADVERGLDLATRNCRKMKYSRDKVGHGRELLSRINRTLVREASPECNRLLKTLGL